MKIVVLGGGESGVGAAFLAKKRGLEVFLSDRDKIKDKYKSILLENQIDFEEGAHSEERILSADWVIKSPGIPKKAEVVGKIHQKGIRLSSELEFAYHFTDAKIIAITGSNGKTTTTSLIYHILKNEGYKVGLGGNIGKSFAYQVATEDYEYYVLEVSSFQLDDIQDFKPHISILLNLSKDHLDRYNYSYEDYVLAKFRIIENQGVEHYFIYNADDEMIRQLLKGHDTRVKKIPFSMRGKLKEGGYSVDDQMIIKLSDEKIFKMKVSELSLFGNHNIANSLAAGIASKLLKIKDESIINSLKTFQSVPHRLEIVAEIEGVKFVNDSKATNVSSAYYALESMKRPIIWIMGGIDKGNDYSEIEDLVVDKVKAIVCLGLDNQKIIDFFREKVDLIFDTSSMERAVEVSKSLMKSGDTVLLSPCCSSFDLFQNYEERGDWFKSVVLNA